MTLRLAIALCASVISFAHAGAPARPRSVVALTRASLTGTGPILLKKVKAASTGRVVFFDHDGEWIVFYAIALATPLQSPELDLKISDVSRTKQRICTRHKLVYSDLAVVRGSLRLGHDDVSSPNAKLLLEIESDGAPVAQREFYIQSKAGSTTPKVVEFTDDDTTADDEIDAKAIAADRH